jgi:hypothetical protein
VETQSPNDYDTKKDCNMSSKSSIADLQPSAINKVPIAQIHKKPQHKLTAHHFPTNQEVIQAQVNMTPEETNRAKPKASSKLNKRPKQVRPPDQLSLYDFQTTFPISKNPPQETQTKDIWGHSLERIDKNSVFRVLLQNPRGLKLGGDQLNTQYSLSLCQALEAGAVCLPETNTNWGHRQAHSIMHNLLRKTWKHSSYSTSYTMEAFDSINQPGGTLQIITNNWTSRILEKGTDPFGLGRWTYTIMRGAHNKKVVIITAYRVCIQSVTSAGLTTATAQQYRDLSRKTREHNIGEDLKPRKQFIMDLQAWIEHLVANGHGIILSLDANEDTYGMPGSFTPLQYSLARPTVGSGHDSSLATLARTCGLVDPLLVQHPDSPPPSTYSRGNSRIDYILLSHSLLPAVLRSGILPYDSVFISDHRPCYIDLDASTLFRDKVPNIEAASRRGLQLQDPRIVQSYQEHLRKQLDYHNISQKIDALYKQASEVPNDPSIPLRYEKIDRILTESMLYAEKRGTKKYTDTYQWSPALAAAVNAVKYWRIRIKQLKKVKVAEETIRKAAEAAKLPLPGTRMTTTEVLRNLREAHRVLKQHQKNHIELREKHLDSLAEARVVAVCPALKFDANKMEKATEKEIRRILRNERCRRSHRLVRRCLKSQEEKTGLAKVEVPTDRLADPKTWNGPWQVLTAPEEIAQEVCKANATQYHQAYDTPFATEPLSSYIGMAAAATGANEILQGNLPPEAMTTTLLPETQAILKAIRDMPKQPSSLSQGTSITREKFQALYKNLHEKTSSSPSGRHVGHYKAIATFDDLSDLWAEMMQIPHLAGFSPKRWQKVVDVMLEKSPGNSKLHRLRIIALQESDFNQSNRLAIGRPVMHHLEDTKRLPKMQHGSRPAKLCISAVLNKQLQFEIKRYQKKPIAYIENDATGCYDRIVNPLVLLFLRKLGVPDNIVKSVSATWEGTAHHIKTVYGVSETNYKNSIDYFLFGPGQGSTIGPLLWLLCFVLIVQSLSAQAPQMSMTSVDGKTKIAMRGDAFVDDAGLGHTVNLPKSADLGLVRRLTPTTASHLQILAQQWERLLFSTGGALNLQKCFWFMLSWRWYGGRSRLDTTQTMPAEIKLTAGTQVDKPSVIQRIEPTDSYRTLGVHISPSGSNKGAIRTMTATALEYAQAITSSHLTRADTLTSYVQHLLPKIRYQLPALSLSTADCNKLMTPLLKAALPKLHINRNTARSIVHGPVTLGGMALPHLATVQGIDKLHLLLGHTRLEDDTGKLLQIDISYVQLLSGSSSLFLNKPYSDYGWIEWGWVTSLWSFLEDTNFTFTYTSLWIPPIARVGDLSLMDYFISQRLSHRTLAILNSCRIYLQVITLADITSADGRYILPEAKAGTCIPHRTSNLEWPIQGRPSPADWRLWRHTLAYLEDKGQLVSPLGSWLAYSHQKWHTYYNPVKKTVLLHTDAGAEEAPPVVRTTRYTTREAMRPLYDMSQLRETPLPVETTLLPATIQSDKHNASYVSVDCSPNTIPLPITIDPPTGSTLQKHIRRLVGKGEHLAAIREAIAKNSLTITTDGSYDPVTTDASYSWVFTARGKDIHSGSSSITSPNRNAYRAELLGQLASLYILEWVEELYPGITGTVSLISDSGKALRQAFRQGPIGVKDATQDEFDIILAIRRQRQSLKTTITVEWTPGHPSPADPRGEQVKNATAHKLAVARLKDTNSTGFDDDIQHIFPITILYKGSPITKGLPQQVSVDVHYNALKEKLKKDNEWDEKTFGAVDWGNYHKAIISLPRPYRLSISKLSHNLWNTNEQNSKYYGHDSSCPYCTQTETQTHLFTCSSSAAAEARKLALKTLQESLAKFNTPQPLADLLVALLSHTETTIKFDSATHHLVGSQRHLGQNCLHRGHVSTAWRTTYLASLPKDSKRKAERADSWAKNVIVAIWSYSITLWKARNAVVHGQTTLQEDSKTMRLLKNQSKQYFSNYKKDPHAIPADRRYLFDKPLEVVLQFPKQQLKCWIASVEEAIATGTYRATKNHNSMKGLLKKFLIPRTTAQAPNITVAPTIKRSPLAPPLKRNSRNHKQRPYRASYIPRCIVKHSPATPESSPGLSISVKSPPITSKTETTSETTIDTDRNENPFIAHLGMPFNSRTRRPRRKTKICLTPIIKVTSKRHRKQPPRFQPVGKNQTRLMAYGFVQAITRAHRDREAEKLDFSGSFISTTP